MVDRGRYSDCANTQAKSRHPTELPQDTGGTEADRIIGYVQ